MKAFFHVMIVLLIVLSACSGKKSEGEKVAKSISYSIKKIFPHDSKAYVQGLTVANGKLFESTGQIGRAHV